MTQARAITILLIEDEPSVTAFVRAALERHGYGVVPAASGMEGLAHLAQGKFAGVISDIRMPGSVNGSEVHDWIRVHRPELQQRVILMSGDTANNKTQALLQFRAMHANPVVYFGTVDAA